MRGARAMLILFAAVMAAPTAAQNADDNIRVLYAARDLCVGVLAAYANAPDKNAEISFDQGEFKVTIKEKGIGVTVLQGSKVFAEVPKFDYASYTACLDNMTKSVK